jgi:CubicO group peptidase (beta-lactamase class C family)
MNENEEISNFLQERIDANDFPSAVYLVAEKGKVVFQDALGLAVAEPERIPARIDTIYDVASLTKQLLSGLLASKLLEKNEFELDDDISKFVPEFNRGGLSVRNLAFHTSGFKAWVPLYLIAGSMSDVPEVIAGQPLAGRRNAQVIYSDLNFIILALIIEKIRGRRIDHIAREELFAPLGFERTIFKPNLENWSQVAHYGGQRAIAASEKGNEYERQTCFEQGYLSGANEGPRESRTNFEFREYQIWGEVHDGNAWFMGGVAGHAGLFSTAEEVFKIALQFLRNHTQLLKPETCELFSSNFTMGLNQNRSLAFQLGSTEGSTAGTAMSPKSFGHNGFTGTSLWIDPAKERVFVLLTNRTHNHQLPFVNINFVRRRFHDLAIEALDRG